MQPDFIFTILRGLEILIFVDALLSFFMTPDKFPRSLTTQITDPLYAPIRAIVRPDKIGFDVSPIILLMLLRFMASLLHGALS